MWFLLLGLNPIIYYIFTTINSLLTTFYRVQLSILFIFTIHSPKPIAEKMENDLELDFGSLITFDNYVILVVNEGVSYRTKENKILMEILKDIYKDNNFTIISYRMFSFSVDPIVYYQLSKLNSLIGICVVSEDESNIGTAEFEKSFYQKEFKLQNSIEEAKKWAEKLNETYRLDYTKAG